MKKSLFLLLLFGITGAFAQTAPLTGYQPGDRVNDFKLKNVDGRMIALADIQNAKGYIVVFTCNHCPFSVAYEDRIIQLHTKYAPLGYPVVAINPNSEAVVPEDSYENMIVRAKEKKFPFVYLRDESQEIAKAYGATRTPHVFIVSKNENDLILSYVGAIDDNADEPSAVSRRYTEEALDALLKGKKPEPAKTKAIGCTVKWKKS